MALILLLVFAVKTRSKIRRWGQERILWEDVKVISEGPRHSVGEWVSHLQKAERGARAHVHTVKLVVQLRK